jgi:hypothetical protein
MANLKLTVDEALMRIEELRKETIQRSNQDFDKLTKELAEGIAAAGRVASGDLDFRVAEADVAVLLSDIRVSYSGRVSLSLALNGQGNYQDGVTVEAGNYIALVLLKKKPKPPGGV